MRKSIIKGFYKGLSFLFLMGMMFSIFNSEIEAWEDKQEDRSLPAEDAQTTTDIFIDNKLQPHFAPSGKQFNPVQPASQAFERECGENYLFFKENFEYYYIQDGSSKEVIVNNIKQSAKSCSTKVFNNYYVFSKNFEQKIETAFKMRSGEVYSILQSADGSSPANVQSLKRSLEEWQSFKANCISFVENKSMKQFGKAQELPSENLGVVLKGLQERNCPSQRKQMERFKNSQLFANFLELSNPCNGVEGCVQKLKERVSSSGRSVFKVCREEQSQAEACCQTPLKCSYYPESKSHYQALLGSEGQAGSQKTEICQSNPASLANWANKTTEICSNSVNLCQNSCQEQLTAFREEFLQCFFLPDLQDKSLSLHGKNACQNQISAIKGKFKELAKNFKEPDSNFQTNLGSNSNSSSSLNSLDQSSLSSPHAIAINCKKPLQDLDSQARAKAVYGELCGEFLAQRGSNQGTGESVNLSPPVSADVSSRNTQGSFSGRDQSGSSFARDGGSSRSINGGARGEGESLGGRMISGGGEFLSRKKKEEDIRAEFADGKDPIMNPFGEDKEFYPTRAFFNRKKWGVISDEQLEMEKKFEELLKREGFESEDDYKEYYNIVEKEKEEIAQAEGPLSKAVAYAKGKGRRMMSFVKRKAREAYNARYGDPREKRRLLKWWNELPGPEVDLMEEQKRLLLMFCRERNTCKKWGWETEEEEEDETLKSPATQPPATQPPATQPPATQPPATQPVQPSAVPSSGP